MLNLLVIRIWNRNCRYLQQTTWPKTIRNCSRPTLRGFEAMNMIRKGQFSWRWARRCASINRVGVSTFWNCPITNRDWEGLSVLKLFLRHNRSGNLMRWSYLRGLAVLSLFPWTKTISPVISIDQTKSLRAESSLSKYSSGIGPKNSGFSLNTSTSLW